MKEKSRINCFPVNFRPLPKFHLHRQFCIENTTSHPLKQFCQFAGYQNLFFFWIQETLKFKIRMSTKRCNVLLFMYAKLDFINSSRILSSFSLQVYSYICALGLMCIHKFYMYIVQHTCLFPY